MATLTHVALVASAFGWEPPRKGAALAKDGCKVDGGILAASEAAPGVVESVDLPKLIGQPDGERQELLRAELERILKAMGQAKQQTLALTAEAEALRPARDATRPLEQECEKLVEMLEAVEFELDDRRRSSEKMTAQLLASVDRLRADVAAETAAEAAALEAGRRLQQEAERLREESAELEREVQLLQQDLPPAPGWGARESPCRVVGGQSAGIMEPPGLRSAVEVLQQRSADRVRRTGELQRQATLWENLRSLRSDRIEGFSAVVAEKEHSCEAIAAELASSRKRLLVASERAQAGWQRAADERCSGNFAALLRMCGHLSPIAASLAASLWWLASA